VGDKVEEAKGRKDESHTTREEEEEEEEEEEHQKHGKERAAVAAAAAKVRTHEKVGTSCSSEKGRKGQGWKEGGRVDKKRRNEKSKQDAHLFPIRYCVVVVFFFFVFVVVVWSWVVWWKVEYFLPLLVVVKVNQSSSGCPYCRCCCCCCGEGNLPSLPPSPLPYSLSSSLSSLLCVHDLFACACWHLLLLQTSSRNLSLPPSLITCVLFSFNLSHKK